jgi:predicted glycoside hydrolase/deacetylase ChbG (UPF0249 family)
MSPARKVNIIISGDDLGMCDAVNESIYQLIKEGCVTSASLMVNAPSAEAAIAQSSEYPRCSFGVHLNVTEFRPLTTNPALQAIMDGEGRFAGQEVVRGAAMTSSLRKAIADEWIAQIETARALGLRVCHLDSHHSIHTLPALFFTLKDVQKRSHLRKVRSTQNLYSGSGPGRILLAKKRMWNLALKHWYRTATTCCFADLPAFCSLLASRRVPSCSSIEVMTHPGSVRYGGESELLRTEWQTVAAFPVNLISYNEL